MKVFKFGGASVSTADRIRNVKEIIQSYRNEQLVVVISAMGKTTNALEEVVHAFYQQDKEKALALFQAIKETHLKLAGDLSPEPPPHLQDFFTEVEWLLHDKPVRPFDYYYDQVVCVGELLSTAIISRYLNHSGIPNVLVDVRDVIRTDNTFRDARIDWVITTAKVDSMVRPLFTANNIVITQGFIGATDENESTTLGREGSDYTAAVFANLLQAESQTIWKDVPGVMNADPKIYPKAQWIRQLNYNEVIEMAYYGAQVIHPKTIKPIQNKNIPLYVKSFLNPQDEGTVIHNRSVNHLPPILMYKQTQALLELKSKDFSFISEGLNMEVNALFQQVKFKPNLTQITAITYLCVVDDRPDKVEQFAAQAAQIFDVQIRRGLTLLTIRHYNEDILAELTKDKSIWLRQQTKETIQVVME